MTIRRRIGPATVGLTVCALFVVTCVWAAANPHEQDPKTAVLTAPTLPEDDADATERLQLDPDHQRQLALLVDHVNRWPDPSIQADFCFAQGTPREVIEAFCQEVPSACGRTEDGRYYLGGRWPGTLGSPIALTWSFVPDGCGSSQLFATMDAKFGGNRALWVSKFQACFDRWEQLCGIDYTRITYGGNDWDDGASWGSSGSSTRGDIRIRSIYIDGPNGVLGYDTYPSGGGDMTLDKDENWAYSLNNYRFLRQVVMHENGHGIGLAHICPPINLWIMEPYINENFDGPQHDDVRGAQRYYGDPYEEDNTYSAANDLGTLVHNQTVTLGPVPGLSNTSYLSIDANGEQDWFKFTIGFDGEATVTVSPVGLYYDNSSQSCSGGYGIDCCDGSYVDSRDAADLNFQIYGQNGTTLLATGASSPVGSAETLSHVPLSGGAGTFYVRVYEGDAPSYVQMYSLFVQVFDAGGDLTPPEPDPMTWASQPSPVLDAPSLLTMTATTATDLSQPIEYYFACTGGSCHDGGWQTDETYVDSGLSANSPYTYTVTARDGSEYHNETQPSSGAQAITSIEKPTTISFSNVTETSMQVNVPGTFSNLAYYGSGIYLEVTLGGAPAGGGDANTWKKSQTFNVTGLTADTTYTFRAKARNMLDFETTYTVPFTQATSGGVPTGACCLDEYGTCEVGTEQDCLSVEGTYMGDGTDCDPNPCLPPEGACCFDDGSCTFGTEADCVTAGGTYWGDGTDCDPNPCPPPCSLLGDVNVDGTVDGDDIPGFVRAKLGQPAEPGENQACADYGTGTLAGDIDAFIADLLAS